MLCQELSELGIVLFEPTCSEILDVRTFHTESREDLSSRKKATPSWLAEWDSDIRLHKGLSQHVEAELLDDLEPKSFLTLLAAVPELGLDYVRDHELESELLPGEV
jgi:hypothetical protein